MFHKVVKYCKDKNLIDKGDCIVLGVSGGADSMCLLYLLHEMKELFPLNLAVVHINHGLREEAKVEGEYVKRTCEKLHIPFFLFEENVEAYGEMHHLSVEEAGRAVRYQAFRRVLNQEFGGCGKIAVAHNKNDRAETVLFHLFRGSGMRGLTGIPSSRDQIIRPLLGVERKEIEEYLHKKEVSYYNDASNSEDVYTRNRIRHHILGYATQHISEQAVLHVDAAAEIFLEAEDYIWSNARPVYDECVAMFSKDGQVTNNIFECKVLWIKEDLFTKHPHLIQKYVIMEALRNLTDGAKDITAVHIKEVTNLFHKQVSKRLDLPYSITAKREYDGISMEKELEPAERTEDDIKTPVRIDAPGTYLLDQKTRINVRIFDYDKREIIPQNTYTKWFDYDKIDKHLLLRSRQHGDYLCINEKNSTKMLSDYFINEKVPKDQRDKILLLADGEHILWVIGHRISQHYKVNESTKKIVEIQVLGGDYSG